MSRYTATIAWIRAEGTAFTDRRYSRAHRWLFDGGVEVPASASPHIVPLPYSVAENVDPEEAFVAALASCHMLFFLDFAARHGLLVDRYEDAAEGILEKDGNGTLAMTRVVLKPRVAYGGPPPDRSVEAGLHHSAHEACFLARSVKSTIDIDLG
jgi:organic hydroperoxide reductase OsmC/OhrA